MKKFLKRFTMYLIKKQPEIEKELLVDYLDKQVVQCDMDVLNVFRDGERVAFENVVLYKSSIHSCKINTKGFVFLGSDNMLTENFIDYTQE